MGCFCRTVMAVLAVAALSVFGAETACADPTVVNGSFEADPFSFGGTLDLGGASPLTGWTTLNNGIYPWGLPDTNTYNGGPTPYGNQWVIVGNFGQGGTWIQQTVSGFVIGETYTLDFALASEFSPGGVGSLVEVSFPVGSGTAAQIFEAPDRGPNYWDTWADYSMVFVAAATDVTFRISGLAGAGYDAGIDNVHITGTGGSVPEPGTLALAGLGAACVALSRRRQKHRTA